MRKLALLLAVISLAAIMAQTAPLQAAPRYQYHNLGTGPGDAYSSANAVNHSGRVVGWSADVTFKHRACLKDPGQAMQDLFAAWPDVIESEALGVNANGHVVGWFRVSDQYHAFWKSPDLPGKYRDLGTFGGTSSYAYGINSANQVVGYAENASGCNRAFRVLDPLTAPALQDLGTLGGNESEAYGVNDSGLAVGRAQDAHGNWRAFIKPDSKTQPMTSLGVMGGGSESCACAINNPGQVVGYADNADGDKRPFLKNPGEAMQDLGTPEGGQGEAYSLNDSSQVAGSIFSDNWYAALWENGAYYLLDDLTVNLPAGVQLMWAKCINAQGWIVGLASDGVHDHAFLLTPVKTVHVPLDLLLE